MNSGATTPLDAVAPASATDRTLTRRVLIAAINPRSEALSAVIDDAASTAAVDWQWLLERAATHRVAALAAARIRARLVHELPAAVRERLAEIGGHARERAEASQRTLRWLDGELRRSGVPYLLLKGSVLAELVYRDPLIRPFYDIDVIVRRTALPVSESLLGDSGYRLTGVWPLLGQRPRPRLAEDAAAAIARRFYLRALHNLSYTPPRDDARRPIELHWNIAPYGRLRVRDEQLWEHRAPVRVAGIAVETLDPAARLIHFAVHALDPWFHGFKLLHLCDLAWSIDTAPVPADLWARADAWGAAHSLELAIRLADRLFALPGAAAALADRTPSAAMRICLRVLDAQVLVDRNVDPGDPWPRRAAIELAWGLAVRGLRAKLRYSIGRRIATWRWRVVRQRAARTQACKEGLSL